MGKWIPGSANIFINRNAVRYAALLSGRTVAQELRITAYHEAFHRGIYPASQVISRLLGYKDIYAQSPAWRAAEEWAAETYGVIRAKF